MKFSSHLKNNNDLIKIGSIVGPHGVRGVVRVYSYAESVDCFKPQSDLIIIDADGNSRLYNVVYAQPHKNILRLTLKDVTTRSQAEMLTGCEVFIPKAALPVLADDTYYWVDLIGMVVYTQEAVYLGRVEEIIATSANDVYVVRGAEGKGDGVSEVLIPAIASVVLEIDVAKRCMCVALPDGLMEL